MGLLSRASNLDETQIIPGLAFSDFTFKYSLKACVMLEQKDTEYCIKQSIGFDALSIISSISTVDFWKGICPVSKQIYKFTGAEISPLLQLFSINLKDEVKEIYIYKNNESKILLSLTAISEEAADAFEGINNEIHKVDVTALNPQIKESSSVLKFMLELSEAIESFLTSELKSNKVYFDLIEESILNEIYNRFVCFYNTPDSSVKSKNNIIKTVFITGKAYSVELIINHLIINLKEVLGDYAELISVNYCGSADSFELIQNFLRAE